MFFFFLKILYHPISKNHIQIFSEVLCLVRHYKSKCPEARGNWLCCHLLVFLVLQRGISYSDFEARSSPSPVGEKYGLSRANVIHVVGNEQVFFMKSVTLAVVSLKVVFNASSPIRGHCFVLRFGPKQSPSFLVECLWPHFCSLNDFFKLLLYRQR